MLRYRPNHLSWWHQPRSTNLRISSTYLNSYRFNLQRHHHECSIKTKASLVDNQSNPSVNQCMRSTDVSLSSSLVHDCLHIWSACNHRLDFIFLLFVRDFGWDVAAAFPHHFYMVDAISCTSTISLHLQSSTCKANLHHWFDCQDHSSPRINLSLSLSPKILWKRLRNIRR